ncbi:MAG: hypothetical protein M1823_006455 [Watsoniomyces obsoletus]|nr:MAG: hypothetical protein M1823_006455 [Watsoniomyces obsoletus]
MLARLMPTLAPAPATRKRAAPLAAPAKAAPRPVPRKEPKAQLPAPTKPLPALAAAVATKVAKAKAKMEKHGVGRQSQQAEPSMEYRDRARERRKIYGVVNKKGEQVGGSSIHKARSSRASSDDESAAAQAQAQTQSKGASLLSKMGYTAGQGLGASGEGMTAPIAQDVYVQGVGLGAQGGKVGDAVEQAEKNTKGDYKSWAESVRQGARERYSRM